MKPAIESQLMTAGCFTILIAAGVFVYLSQTVHGAYFLLSVLLVWGWLKFCSHRGKAAQKIEQAALEDIFRPTNRSAPVLQRGSSYAYPTFTLLFQSKSDYDQAEALGCVAAFKEFLRSRYAHEGPKRRPFDVDMALSCRIDENAPIKITGLG